MKYRFRLENYFDVLVLLQFSCFRKYVSLDLVQAGSVGFLFLMDLIYSSVKSLILGWSRRGHNQQNSCLFPILVHGSLQDLGVVAISRARAWSLHLTLESSSKRTIDAIHSQQNCSHSQWTWHDHMHPMWNMAILKSPKWGIIWV